MPKRFSLLACVLFAFTSLMAGEDVRNFDFKNYSYPWSGHFGWPNHLEWLNPSSRKSVRLASGQWIDKTQDDAPDKGSFPFRGLKLESVEFGDFTGVGRDDAIVVIRYDTGGTQFSYFVYLYCFVDGIPKLMAYFHAGDRAYSGLYKVYAQNQQLVVELFDPNKKTGDCCSNGIIRSRYRWENDRFKLAGPKEFRKPQVSSRIPVSPFGLHQ